MAGKITSLRFQKRTPDRVNVYLDGAFAFGLPAIEAARLRIGQELSAADIQRLQALDAIQKAYDRAVRFLSYRPRSEAEVRRRLAEAAIDETVIDAVVERLTGQGYLDDAEFARFWVENRHRFKPKGGRALRQELRQKGLDAPIIEAAIADLDPLAAAYEAARVKAARLAHLIQDDPAAFRRKLGAFLMRRGFDYEIVAEVVARLIEELSEIASE
ncbi:MAG: RecX family transcriptional regulator [Chloroflexi bacterium HGW-Chloroflexi-1]|nr:MAG: RecX family transcriptional regulator [Chloroflexi bacterium HGW-Chloroflexi-1]